MIKQDITKTATTSDAQLGERIRQYNPDMGVYGVFEHVKAPVAISKFDLCMRAPVEDGDCDGATAASKTIVDATKSWTVDAWAGYLVTVIDGAAPYGETLRVESNTATVLTLAPVRIGATETFSANLGTSHRYSIHHPHFVAKTSGAAVHPAGVAQVAVAAGEYFWMQVCGRSLVNFDGTTDPSVLGEIAVPSSTAGKAKGGTAAAQTAVEAGLGAGIRPVGVVAVNGQCLVDLAL